MQCFNRYGVCTIHDESNVGNTHRCCTQLSHAIRTHENPPMDAMTSPGTGWQTHLCFRAHETNAYMLFNLHRVNRISTACISKAYTTACVDICSILTRSREPYRLTTITLGIFLLFHRGVAAHPRLRYYAHSHPFSC